MSYKFLPLLFCVVLSLKLHANGSEQHYNPIDSNMVKVSLRQIGHELLLHDNDESSRVMPIVWDKDHYRMFFENEIVINADSLSRLVDKHLDEFLWKQPLLIEVNSCSSGKTVYSYIAGRPVTTDSQACSTRSIPQDCYTVRFEPLKKFKDEAQSDNLSSLASEKQLQNKYLWYALIILLPLVIYGVYSQFFKRQPEPSIITGSDNKKTFGNFELDEINMLLKSPNASTELSHKETLLLSTLLNSANTTVKRSDLLKEIWGDDGDYIGRTLDVFISKLRKKLQVDPNIKIVNIRGVGYKLILP